VVVRPGDFYEYCFFHPVVCVRVDDDDVQGISLIDGSEPPEPRPVIAV